MCARDEVDNIILNGSRLHGSNASYGIPKLQKLEK